MGTTRRNLVIMVVPPWSVSLDVSQIHRDIGRHREDECRTDEGVS